MEYRTSYDWMMNNRNQQHLRNMPPDIRTIHCSIASYCTESKNTVPLIDKADVSEIFSTDLRINRLTMLSDPLQKNLADTLPSEVKLTPPNNNMFKTDYSHSMNNDCITSPGNMDANMNYRSESYTGFSGIGSFISSVFSVISSAMPFQRRARSPEACNDADDVVASSSPVDIWPKANTKAQNKNNQNAEQLHTSARVINSNVDNNIEMSVDCHAAAANCEDKLATVRLILENKANLPKVVKPKQRRPRKVFVEAGTYHQSDEEEVFTESLGSIASDSQITYMSPRRNVDADLCETHSPKMKTEIMPIESMDIVTPLSDVSKIEAEPYDESINMSSNLADDSIITSSNPTDDTNLKSQIVASCEEKLNKIRALLPDRRKNTNKVVVDSPKIDPIKENIHESNQKTHRPITVPKSDNKKYKNPHRILNDRKKLRNELRKNIQEDMLLQGPHSDASSIENSPKTNVTTSYASTPASYSDIVSNPDCYFDEISGRFRKTSTTESEDSFQIVFTDSPQNSPQTRKISDCESEDSFIVFEEADNCYTSTDVFGDQPSDDDDSDESTDYDNNESDENRSLCHMSYGLSRTISDLTDSSLYVDSPLPQSRANLDSDDEVDSSVNICDEISMEKLNLDSCDNNKAILHNSLLSPSKKLANKDLPPKKVRFSEEPPKVRVMRVWAYASRKARIGNWEQYALDRERFKRRIADVDMAISWVLKPQHRSRVRFQRFMPWWNAQRRKELEEKKKRQAEEKIKEEERKKAEEEQKKIEQDVIEQEDGVSDLNDVNTVDNTNSTNENVEKSQTDILETVNNTSKDKNKNLVEKSNETNIIYKNKSFNDETNNNETKTDLQVGDNGTNA